MMNIRQARAVALAVSATALLAGGCRPADQAGPAGDAGQGRAAAGARPMPTAQGFAAEGDTIKIGIVGSLTGPQAPWGQDSIAGARMAVEEFNALGGVGGRKVELLVGDSQSRAEGAKSAAEDLMRRGVIGLLGEVASGHTIQVAKSAFAKGVPLIAIGATKEEVTLEGANIFRVCYTDDFQGPVMAVFAYHELGLRNVAIMTDKSQPYSTGLSDNFRRKFEALGGTIVDEQFYESGQAQFSAQLTSLKGKNPEGLFLSGYFNEVGPIARQAREIGLNAKLLGGDGWDSREILTTGGDAIIGGFFCNHYNSREERPEVQAFLSKWRAANEGREPGTTMAALGYDAAGVMLDALKRADAHNSRALIAAIEATEGFPGVTGQITLRGKNGNPPKRALVVEVTREGFEFRRAYEHGEIARMAPPRRP
jgi:branched-chain amino acid transport system substrate-binding protein